MIRDLSGRLQPTGAARTVRLSSAHAAMQEFGATSRRKVGPRAATSPAGAISPGPLSMPSTAEHAQPGGDETSQFVDLLFAGFETTLTLIGSGL